MRESRKRRRRLLERDDEEDEDDEDRLQLPIVYSIFNSIQLFCTFIWLYSDFILRSCRRLLCHRVFAIQCLGERRCLVRAPLFVGILSHFYTLADYYINKVDNKCNNVFIVNIVNQNSF